ncbi:bifunctional phosphoribosylaminoimidazolecarboxamide formyltransferase/IMP cyclohydrolase [bacterium]|nr:bifunctional phosphoribosylaminoimidazolecarboxamide formyltransferase/IMP cyclohydrolase [bacterium]
MSKIERALISVSDKTGIVEFAKELKSFGVEIISTGGTANLLKKEGVNVIEISDYTGFPEMLDGRVKTLHPMIHGGLLGVRDNKEHVDIMKKHNIKPIDMVVVNLYPFEAAVVKQDVTLEHAIENIDIGGPSMLRSAAKNHKFVTVVCDSEDYDKIIKEMADNGGDVSEKTNYDLAVKVFKHTCKYDGAIANYLSKNNFVNFVYEKAQDLRYGENPHQQAVYYKEDKIDEVCIANAKQLHGKELSFNNIIDLNAAIEIVKEFEEPTAVIIKHTNPCGVARAEKLFDAYVLARSVDSVSAFGSIVGFNRPVDHETAREIVSTFVEAVVAPGFDEDAFTILAEKKNIRLLETGDMSQITWDNHEKDMKKVVGGLLVQDRDLGMIEERDLKVATKKKPTKEQIKAMLFAWKVCKSVKSNAIVYSYTDHIIGVGAGQMSRVDSAKIGIFKSNYDIKGSVLASDAFFPFRDGVDSAAKAGVIAIIQPGGSVRDEEVIAACDEHGIAMVFTGMRHFKH